MKRTRNECTILFIKTQPDLEAKVREIVNSGYLMPFVAADPILDALHAAPMEDRCGIDQGIGVIEWKVVVEAFRDLTPVEGIPRDTHRRELEGRRAQMASDIRKMVADAERWNRQHPNDEPIVIDVNFEKDVEAAKWPL